ncbi:MAG: hypothetical protein FWG05_02655 [Kiritimatiellaeota bacterium]|nr:hypothetical protein [Kiritimatiellota bacterium]
MVICTHLRENFTMSELSLTDSVKIKGFSGTDVRELTPFPDSVFGPTISAMLMILGFRPVKSGANERFVFNWRDLIFGFRRKKLIPDQWVKSRVKKGTFKGEWQVKTNAEHNVFQFGKTR